MFSGLAAIGRALGEMFTDRHIREMDELIERHEAAVRAVARLDDLDKRIAEMETHVNWCQLNFDEAKERYERETRLLTTALRDLHHLREQRKWHGS